MPQDEKEDGFWSKADNYQPKTPAMKSWKKKYLEGNQSKYEKMKKNSNRNLMITQIDNCKRKTVGMVSLDHRNCFSPCHSFLSTMNQ